jgi:hypothetical protein
MMNGLPVGAYAGDYYRQKMKGAAEFFDLPFLFDMRAIRDLDLGAVVDQALRSQRPAAEHLRTRYLRMVREYAAMYQHLLYPRLRSPHRSPHPPPLSKSRIDPSLSVPDNVDTESATLSSEMGKSTE